MPEHLVDLLILGSNQTVTVPKNPVDSDRLGVIEDGGVAIDKGQIVRAAASDYLLRKYRARKKIDARGTIILPGLIDPHTHLIFAGSREEEFQHRATGTQYMQSLRGGGGILETVRRTREATTDQLYQLAYQRMTRVLLNGTTTVEVKTGYGLDLPGEAKMLRVIKQLKKAHPSNLVGTFLGAHAIPPEHPNSEDYVQHLLRVMLPKCKQLGGATFCDVFCEKGVFTEDQASKVLRAAIRLGYRPKIHADEFADSGGARVANQLSAVSADHCVHSETRELERMNAKHVTPVLLPGSSRSLFMDKPAPAQFMLSLGLPVALGTDFNPANWMFSQLTTAEEAARTFRMRAEDIIRGITTNAARALGIQNRVGSISRGMDADLVLLKAPHYSWIGYTYSDGLPVDNVLIRGKTVAEKGRLAQ